MALTAILTPDGFRPIGAGRLLYTFTEASIAAKPNYRVEIEFDGLDLPVFEYRPNVDLEIECDIAGPLRSVLALSTSPTDRLKSTFVKYQAVWDGGSDAQVELTNDVIYFYCGTDNLLNHRSQFEITSSAGSFLRPDSVLKAWVGRTCYVEFLNGLASGWAFVMDGDTYYGSGVKELVSLPFVGSVDMVGALSQFAWTSGVSAADNSWRAVAYGGGLFVAVASTGTGNRVMTSPDGLTWTLRTSSVDNQWFGLAYGSSLFVAVAATGTGDRVMTSPDGITWTTRTSAGDHSWRGVAYGNSVYVAVSATAGTGNQVMTSPDGITWTMRTSSVDKSWNGVTYASGLFVAVGSAGGVMTSPDGVTWTTRTAAAAYTWKSVTYGNGLFVAVASSGASTDAVMTSPDGITWTLRDFVTGGSISWNSVTYGNGLFVATAVTGSGVIAQSNDGINWNLIATPVDGDWNGVIYGNSIFVAVGSSTAGGSNNRAMYTSIGAAEASITVEIQDECANPIYLRWLNDFGGLSTQLFDYNQELSLDPVEDGRFRFLRVRLGDLTIEEWYALQELNRQGAEFGDNEKLGAFVQDYTDEDNPINVYVMPGVAGTFTKQIKNTFGAVLRYPLLDNIEI